MIDSEKKYKLYPTAHLADQRKIVTVDEESSSSSSSDTVWTVIKILRLIFRIFRLFR